MRKFATIIHKPKSLILFVCILITINFVYSSEISKISNVYQGYQIYQGQQLQKRNLVENNVQSQQQKKEELEEQEGINTNINIDEINLLNIQNTPQIIPIEEQQSHYHKPDEPQFWYNTLLSIVLICVGAFCSGLTVGLCNIDSLQLQVMAISKNQEQEKIAKTILAVIKDHHLFLVTLLVYNAMALESLPLVVHTLMPDWLAIIFSTIFVLIAAQIIPQAFCTGPNKMAIAYYACPIISIMTKVLWIIIYPMAKGLDKLLGVHNHHRVQHKDFANFLTGNKMLKKTQKMLLTSTLQLRCQRVQDRMIPLKNLYMIQIKEELNPKKIQQIRKKQYFYILVYRESRTNIVGIIKAKQFALKFLKLRNKQTLYAQQFIDSNIDFLSVYKDTNLLEMLMLFQSNHSRIALVCDQKKKIQPGIKSIMYTKTDMIIKKKSNIIGAIFLYTIFAEITESQQNIPTLLKQGLESEKIQLQQLNQPLLKK